MQTLLNATGLPLIRPSFVPATARVMPENPDNLLIDEYKQEFLLNDVEAKQLEEQMGDELELEGWPAEVPPDCPVCKSKLRLDETCAGCGWGTIPFLPNGAPTINWTEYDCGT